MNIVQAVFTSLVVTPSNWCADWVWGLPLIVLNVVIHVIGLGFINQRVIRVTSGSLVRRHPTFAFVLVMGVTTLLVTTLHGIEAAIWAAAYRILSALPDDKTAVLYSLSAMTSYGHENLALEGHWQLMGALEALNGWLLFGLTTAFMFGVLGKTRWSVSREGHR
jgi:hypothetical protein